MLGKLLTSWKTSSAGIAAIVTGLGLFLNAYSQGKPLPWGEGLPPIMAGLGLLFAKDSNVTGGTKANSEVDPTLTPPKMAATIAQDKASAENKANP